MINPQTKKMLKAVVQISDEALRAAWCAIVRMAPGRRRSERFRVEALFSARIPKTLEAVSFNHLADDWGDEESLAKLKR